MRTRCYLLALVVAGFILSPAWPDEPPMTPRKAEEFFEKSIRPVLAENCFNCHGDRKQKAGLRLDSRQALLTGGETGPAIVPGHPEQSLLLKALHYQDELKMPPKGQLRDAEVAALTTWIKQGAPWPDSKEAIRPIAPASNFKISPKDRQFWSFRPFADPPVPNSNDPWAKTAIDHFILAKLAEKQLRPLEAADKRTLIRRATFDLIGLPPKPEEVEAFLKDEAPDAFATVVDRLLASPHYGERWARHWLDVARYGEDQAHTFEARKYPQGFRYRDWLIKAFNDDMPYDRFVMEQIASDLLDLPDRQDNAAALGFFALGPVYYGDPKKLDQYDDRIDTLSRGFLGLTVACARCHDHKFDPISTKDYYGLAGIIASSEYTEIPLVSPEEAEKAKAALSAADKKKKNAPPPYPHIHAIKEGKPVTLNVHIRGNPATLGELAPHGFLSILAGEKHDPFTKGSGRLELAQAIASANNPLTARVMVNRIWKHHFGKGLVRTPSNFGALGEPPTHPELLDYLATRFIASGWSIKEMHRAIMLSEVYQTSSRFDAKQAEVDGDNKLVWHGNRRRLDVESWRDAMLAVSGNLDETVGGPSTDLAKADNRRRTLYGIVSRHELNPLLRLFDFPDPNITSDSRTITTVPLQQLFVLNSEFMVRNAKALSKRLVEQAPDDSARIRQAFLLLFGRPATERDLSLGMAFLSAEQDSATLTRWEQYAQVLLSANEFMFVD